MTWPMTLAGLPRAGAISKPHDYKQIVQKMEGLLKKWVLTGKQVEDFRQKNSKNPLLPWRTKQKNHKTPKAKTKHEPGSHEELKWSKIEKKQSEKNGSNSARLELRIKSWPVQTLCDLDWSWDGQWRWQGYHVQAQFQSSMITNRTYKKWKAF